VASDPDDILNDKDDFIKQFANAAILSPLGYDLVGLAGSPVHATLRQGDYLAVHTYGWTEFAIHATSQQLEVTTWGVPSYTRAQMQADPQGVIARQPAVVSRFTVVPR